jgi:hypothetical protein
VQRIRTRASTPSPFSPLLRAVTTGDVALALSTLPVKRAGELLGFYISI